MAGGYAATQRAGAPLLCQAPHRTSCIPAHPSLNRRCNISLSPRQRTESGGLSSPDRQLPVRSLPEGMPSLFGYCAWRLMSEDFHSSQRIIHTVDGRCHPCLCLFPDSRLLTGPTAAVPLLVEPGSFIGLEGVIPPALSFCCSLAQSTRIVPEGRNILKFACWRHGLPMRVVTPTR